MRIRCAIAIAVALTSWQCSRPSSTSSQSGSPAAVTPGDASSALKAAVTARTAAFVDDGERGRHAWHESNGSTSRTAISWRGATATRPRATRGRVDQRRPRRRPGRSRAGRLSPRRSRRRAPRHADRRSGDRARSARQLHLHALRLPISASARSIRKTSIREWHAAPRTLYQRDALQAGLGGNNIARRRSRGSRRTSPQYRGTEASARAGAAEAGRRRHRADRDEHGAVALAARRSRLALPDRQHPRIPPRRDRERQERARHEGGDRQEGRVRRRCSPIG